MTVDVERRIARSAEAFHGSVWPAIRVLFPPGNLVCVEHTPGELGSLLDRDAGIDYLYRPAIGRPIGLASRVSDTPRGRTPHRRFTMGKPEHKRLTEALARPVGSLIPAVRIQASVTRANDAVARVDHVGLVFVADLIRLGQRARVHVDGPTGGYWSWDIDDLLACGVAVREVPEPRLSDPFAA